VPSDLTTAQRSDETKDVTGAPGAQMDASMPFDVSGLGSVTLAEVMASAAQLTRVDRKYLVSVDIAQALLDRVAGTHRLLVIDGRASTTYRSTYFDTADLETARAHVQGRRRRWKARSRLYVEDQLCRLEVKTKDARGATVKTVVDSDPSRYGTLLPSDSDFIDSVLRDSALPHEVRALRPTAEVTYQRATLADLEASTRVTLDWGVACTLPTGRVWVDPAYVLVETKGGSRPGLADRVLAEHRVRPNSFSKYVAGVALLDDSIPANDFLALFGRQLHSTHTGLAAGADVTGDTADTFSQERAS
jgi:hypothetical protein